jgi:hypothetical protein
MIVAPPDGRAAPRLAVLLRAANDNHPLRRPPARAAQPARPSALQAH